MRVVHLEVGVKDGTITHKSTIMNTHEGILEAIRLLMNSSSFTKLTVEFYDTDKGEDRVT